MASMEISKQLLLRVYDNVSTVQDYVAIRCKLPSAAEEDMGYQKFVQETLIAFSESQDEVESVRPAHKKKKQKLQPLPIPTTRSMLEKIASDCSEESIPKDLVMKYFIVNETHFDRLLTCITETLDEPEERKCALGAEAMFRLLKNGSLFTCLQGRNFIQRTGRSIDFIVSSGHFSPKPILFYHPAASPSATKTHSRLPPVRRKKRKTKDLSSSVIYAMSFMYNSFAESGCKFRRMFANLSAAGFIEREFLFQHQILLRNGCSSLQELMKQLIQRHNRFFTRKFSVQRICPVRIAKHADVSELVSKYNTHADVCDFLRITLFAVFPFQLFGTKKQRRKFYRSLTLLITSPYTVRYEYKNMIRGITMDQIEWLSRLETSEAKRNAFGSFSKWAVNYFICLLRGFFYATETQFGKFKIFFYQKHIWNRICKHHTTSGLRSTLQPEACNYYERTRLIPKSSSVRMICPDLEPMTSNEGTERRALVSVLQMLRSDSRPLIYDNFSEFCTTVRCIDPNSLFMIKADIRDCYPCIKQDVLMDIIRQKVRCFFGDGKKIRCREIRSVFANAGSLKVQSHFVPILHQQETPEEQELNFDGLRNRVLVPLAEVAIEDPVEKIISQFQGNVIRQNENLYLMSEGIRQGSRLSPELCSLYMESFLYSMFHGEKKLHIAVKADDILLASCVRETAEAALLKILDGSQKFNFRVNKEKIFTNFASTASPSVQVQSLIPFCGVIFDCENMSVTTDYSRFSGDHLKYSFSCNPFQRPYHMARYLANQMSHMRSHLMDSRIIDEDVIVKNFFERSLFQSMRFACFLLASDSHKRSQDAKLLEFFARLVSRKAYKLHHNWVLRQESPCFSLSESEVHFICSSAILLWEKNSNLRKRKQEKQSLLLLKETNRQQIESSKNDKWSAIFSPYPAIFPVILIK